jgi:predicted nucleic acid-binding protein
MIYFLDTSALMKRYFDEPGSREVQRLFKRNEEIALSRIAEAEAAAVICRAHHEREISDDVRDRALEQLAADVAAARVIEIRRTLMKIVRDLVRRRPLRGYDAVQLACAVKLKAEGGAVDVWCADGDLADAARAEGLRTTVPE